jgi:hypothetical protein
MAKGKVSEKIWWLGFVASGFAGVIYVALTHSTPAQGSVLHRTSPFQAVLTWLSSPYLNLPTAFLGAAALSATLLFKFKKFNHQQKALLFFFLGASLAMLVFSVLALSAGG